MVSNIGYLISVQGVISRDCLADCPQSPLHRRRSRVEALVGVFADALADVLLAALTRSVEHCRSALKEIVVEIRCGDRCGDKAQGTALILATRCNLAR